MARFFFLKRIVSGELLSRHRGIVMLSRLLVLLPLLSYGSQETDQFLKNYMETHRFSLGHPRAFEMTPDGSTLLYLRSEARDPKQSLFELDIRTQTSRILLIPEELAGQAEPEISPEEKARRERMRLLSTGLTQFELAPDGQHVLVPYSGDLYWFHRTSKALRKLKKSDGHALDPQLSPDGNKVAYVIDYDLFMFDIGSSQETRLTTNGSAKISNGLAEFVAQEEMGRHSGFWWSPDSRHLVYEQADASEVENWFVSDPAYPEREPHPSFYPRPGKANVETRFGVVGIEGRKTVWIDWDRERYPYVPVVQWEKNTPLTLTAQTRDQSEFSILKVDPSSGETDILVKITNPAWPAWWDLQVGRIWWLPGGSSFLITTLGKEGRQLEWRARSGELKRVVADDEIGFRTVLAVLTNGGSSRPARTDIVLLGGRDTASAHLFRLRLPEGDLAQWTDTFGVHSADFFRGTSQYVHQMETPRSAMRTVVRDVSKDLAVEVPSAAMPLPWLPNVEFTTVRASHLFTSAIVKPREFIRGKKYPVLVDVYGGPIANNVLARARRWMFDQWLADQGFIIVAIDNRGTPGRSAGWEHALRHRLGSVPIHDQAEALKALAASFPELDLARVGIFGWSFGGYMSALAVLRHGDLFKAAVAGAPVVDWMDYDTHYTERYLGVPDGPSEPYSNESLLAHASMLERPLLIIHGTADDNVYFRHSLKLADALTRAGREFELLPLSGMTHMIREPELAEAVWTRVAKFFKQHLADPE